MSFLKDHPMVHQKVVSNVLVRGLTFVLEIKMTKFFSNEVGFNHRGLE